MRRRLEGDGEPTEITDWLELLRGTGRVCPHGCRYAAATSQVAPEAVLPAAAEGIVDPGWFLREKAQPADHCQYF